MKILSEEQRDDICEKCEAYEPQAHNACMHDQYVCLQHLEAQARLSMAEGKVETLKKLHKARMLVHDYSTCYMGRYHATCKACYLIKQSIAELEEARR